MTGAEVDSFLAPFRKGKGFNISGAMRNACRQEGGPFEVYPLGVESDGRRSGPDLNNVSPGTSPPHIRVEVVPLTSPRVLGMLSPHSYKALVEDIKQGAADLSKIVPPSTVWDRLTREEDL